MSKLLFPALFVAVLPVCLSIATFAYQPRTIKIDHTWLTVYNDSTPVHSKTSSRNNSASVKTTQKKKSDPKRFKGSVVDTAGIIYDLNAFYPLGN